MVFPHRAKIWSGLGWKRGSTSSREGEARRARSAFLHPVETFGEFVRILEAHDDVGCEKEKKKEKEKHFPPVVHSSVHPSKPPRHFDWTQENTYSYVFLMHVWILGMDGRQDGCEIALLRVFHPRGSDSH